VDAVNRGDKRTNERVSAGAVVKGLFARLANSQAAELVRPASQFNLGIALQALETEGVAGTLTIRIPAKTGAPLEIEYASASYK